MKKNYKIMVMVLVMVLSGMGFADAQRIVKISGWDVAADPSGDPDTYNNQLYDAINADSTLRKTDPNVIYELKRNHLYVLGKRIENRDYKLHIRAEAGEGMLPEVIVGKTVAGGYGEDYIRAYNDITLENIAFNGHTPEGGVLNRMIEVFGAKARFEVLGCAMDGDRGGFIVPQADSMTIIIKNSVFGNSGHRVSYGGNGRLIDFRPDAKYIDTCIVENSTVYNITDRIIRNQGSQVNYLKIDHITVLNNTGVHGCIQLGNVKTASVTNSVFGNAISLGHSAYRTNEQLQDDKHFAVITLDSIWTSGQTITIRNNNIYNDQELVDVWAKYDSVESPNALCATTKQAIGSANLSAAAFSEPLVFKTICGPISDYVDAYYTNPASATFPENWCVGGQDGYFYDQIDVSYANTYQSYTAADNGKPVGSLLNFGPLSSLRSPKTSNPKVSVYPNPAFGKANFGFVLETPAIVRITVFDITGSQVKLVANSFMGAGTHNVEFDGSMLPSGVYYYSLEAGPGITNGKMVLY
ncbi:MAG: T9SS type A sorting domain-containing protein [Bacteroidales bacterium]|nr:T9SS type A sorting domain-containing protein [Bacteroidales bacterium]